MSLDTEIATPALDPALLVDLHGDYLYRFALHRVGDKDTAERALVETLTRAIREADDYDPKFTARVWLTTIVKRVIDEHFKQHARGRHSGKPDALTERTASLFADNGEWCHRPSSWRAMPATPDDQREFAARIRQVVKLLPPQVAELFVLHEQQEIAPERAAEQVGISTGELFAQMHRVRLLVRRGLDQLWFAPRRRP